jgi:hypothetical protein
MNVEIIEEPIRFHLHGIGGVVENERYGEVGLRLMNEMWQVVKRAGIPTTGINHWVYLPDGKMFVGVELRHPQQAPTPEQLESLDEMLDQLSDAKGEMGDMEGDSAMNSQMAQMGQQGQSQMDGIPGYGLNEGKGRGDRPEEKTDTASYDSQAQGKIGKGKAVMIGHADGPNIKGQTREDVKEAVLETLGEKSDPLTDAQLPKDQKDHAREYFEKYQDGNKGEAETDNSETTDKSDSLDQE